MASENRPDFVMVRLTDRGQELAGKGPLTVSNGRRSFTFSGDAAQEVEKSYEWNLFLRTHTDHNGASLFEIAPAAVAKQPATPPTTTAAVPATASAASTTTAAATTAAAK